MSDNIGNRSGGFGKMVPSGTGPTDGDLTGPLGPPPGPPFTPAPGYAPPPDPYAPTAPYAPQADPYAAVPAYAAQPAGNAAASEPILFSIGDIAVTRHWVITPNGTAPMAGSTWIGQDLSRTEQKIPTWAIVMAVVGFLACLLGLLFLLVKEQVTTGYFEVSVQSGALRHVSQIPVSSPQQLAQIRQGVHQAQTIASAA